MPKIVRYAPELAFVAPEATDKPFDAAQYFIEAMAEWARTTSPDEVRGNIVVEADAPSRATMEDDTIYRIIRADVDAVAQTTLTEEGYDVVARIVGDQGNELLTHALDVVPGKHFLPRSLDAIAAAKERGEDCTQEESALIKAYFDDHDPERDPSGLASRLADLFPCELEEWYEESEQRLRSPSVEALAREAVETFYGLTAPQRKAVPHALYEAIKALFVALPRDQGDH